MTFHRPIKTLCRKGHPRKQVSTTGAYYCPTCTKEQGAINREAERQAKHQMERMGVTR